jgi:hypothetical protein
MLFVSHGLIVIEKYLSGRHVKTKLILNMRKMFQNETEAII